MRKAFLFGMLAVLLLFSVALAGCKKEKPAEYEPESAIALWEKIDKNMEGLRSMKTDIIMDMVYYTMGYEVRMNSSGSVLVTPESYYADNRTTAKCEELSQMQEVSTVEAYCDGKMYTATNDGYYDQKFCSPMAWEDFRRSKSGGSFVDEIDFAACTASKFSKEEDGTWTLQFSGYTKKTIDEVLGSMMISDTELGVTITDMHVKVTADADFYIQKVDISLVFAESESRPRLTVVARYSGFNTTKVDPAMLSLTEYAEVADVRVLNYVSQVLKEKQDLSEGAFTLDITTAYDMKKESVRYEEHDLVSYGRKNGAYYYAIDAQVDDQSLTIAYQNGEQTVTSGDQSQTVTQPEAEAKAFIDSLIDYARYSGISVTDIQKPETGVFVLTVDRLDLSLYQASVAGTGITLESGSQTITVLFADKKLSGIENITLLTANYAEESMQMTITSSLQFE
jgi:predicted heme/steroid binding protein